MNLRARLALVCVAGAVVGQPAPPATADQGVGFGDIAVHDVRQQPQDVVAFWTRSRMRRAEPLDATIPGPAAEPQVPDQAPAPAGPPVLIPPEAPGEEVPIESAVSSSSSASRNHPLPFSTFEVTDTTTYPASTHGKVFFTKPTGGLFVCSANVINAPAHRSLVLTAGHCAHGGVGESYANNFLFVPGYRNGVAPFGGWAAAGLLVFDAWATGDNFRYDVAAAIMAPDAQGRLVEDVVGARGVAFNRPREQIYFSVGYPEEPTPPFDGEKLWVCASAYGGDDLLPPELPGPATMAIGCNMGGGSSGGGWILESQYVNSVNSYSRSTHPNVNYGPYFGTDVSLLYVLAADIRCKGALVTQLGSAEPDFLPGGPGPDVVLTGGGDDTVASGPGDDLICAGDGNDVVNGGAGRDVLYGETGADKLNGAAGRDRCKGGSGKDKTRRCEKPRKAR